MKYLIYFLLFIFNIQKLSAQEDDIKNIGKQIFESIRDIDTAKISLLIPNREEFLGFVNESSATNNQKKTMIGDYDNDSPNFKAYTFEEIEAINKRGQDIGINWNKAVYKLTEMESLDSKYFKSDLISVSFSFNKKKYVFETVLIYYKRYFLVNLISFVEQ